ncbi:flagellar M-ring protein FliF [Cytobacillus eiseniae]|uniref:Flagellar M-ring protein n=1 Tax=Cytobacillus eiseniae TaxID=762947 RepID=A0ABS4RBN5_9BACI|nr:flagellar basal-body MS-ring/collar protein FliF [Cytobacillus eiseniae]MBP2240124.1 flagellar M-ring protein FliF [Cytobacillus eiseniae]
MNESFLRYKDKMMEYWSGLTKKQKMLLFGSVLLLIIFIVLITFFTTRKTLVPLYSNLTPSETGTIKENLDGRGITSEIADGGTTIKVPEKMVDTLKVELAAEGIPNSGNIDYSFFSQNAGIGTTDNEFNMIKLDSMQAELANLIKGIDGVQDAKVMINLPEKGIFVSDASEAASASIILNTKSGYQFEETQIQALYHLVSKSIPNLPTDNIVIMNQFFEYFDLKNNDNNSSPGSTFATQHEIKKQIEKDVQRQVQSMLSTLMGPGNVVVSVSTDIDFTQENREENLVKPVNEEDMEGIAISAQKITETFTGNGDAVGGIPQGEDPSDALGSNYLEGNGSNGDYERIEETINNEVNKIRREIVESPYKVRDLGIQVMVNPPEEGDLPQERIDDITKILGTIVRTTIDKNAGNTALTEDEINDKVVVSVQPFEGKVDFESETKTAIPLWAYIVGGVLLAIIALLIFLFIRAKRKREAEEQELEIQEELLHVPDVNEEHETEGTMRKKQLEKMAKEKPEDFAKLLRTWIAED